MSDNITFINMDDDDDKTVFQTEEERKKLEMEIIGLGDDDTTEVETTERMNQPGRPYWQEVFG